MAKMRLSLSENPYKLPYEIEKKISDEIKRLNLYPHDYYDDVKETIADYYNLCSNNVYIANGSDEMIFLCALKYASKFKKVLINKNTFKGCKHSLEAINVDYLEVELEDYRVNLEYYYELLNEDISMVYICNPHNPTGTVVTTEYMESLICFCHKKDIKVIVDEAYMEYCYNKQFCSVVNLINKYDNLVVIKTLSKIYPMAGIRFGIALSQSKNIKEIKLFKMLPYSVNRIACIMAKECLKDKYFTDKIVDSNFNNKKYMYNCLNKINIKYIESESNFIMIELPNTKSNIADILMKKYDIEVLNLKTLGFNNFIRVTIGTIDQIDYFINSIYKIING